MFLGVLILSLEDNLGSGMTDISLNGNAISLDHDVHAQGMDVDQLDVKAPQVLEYLPYNKGYMPDEEELDWDMDDVSEVDCTEECHLISKSIMTDQVPVTPNNHIHTSNVIHLPDMGLSATHPTSCHGNLEDLKDMKMTVTHAGNQERDLIVPEDVVLPDFRQNNLNVSGAFSDGLPY